MKNMSVNDVEDEDLGEEVSSDKHPFDPQNIKIDHESINLGSIIEDLSYGIIDLEPEFQRNSGLWNSKEKSRLIESLLLGLPLPTFFFANEKKTVSGGEVKSFLVVVDGLQRLTTLKEFIVDKTLKLSNLEFLSKSHDGLYYDDLTKEEHRKIRSARVTISTILENNPDLVKYIVFRRINTGGLVLTQQEIRHALNQGRPADLMKEMAESEKFKKATEYKISQERMLDREFCNRFLAFYDLDIEQGYDGDIDTFMAESLSRLSKYGKDEYEKIKFDFEKSMEACFEIFDDECFRKPKLNSNRRAAISKSLFDTISVNLAKTPPSKVVKIKKEKTEFIRRYHELFLSDEKFNASISNATGTRRHVLIRFKKIRQLIDDF